MSQSYHINAVCGFEDGISTIAEDLNIKIDCDGIPLKITKGDSIAVKTDGNAAEIVYDGEYPSSIFRALKLLAANKERRFEITEKRRFDRLGVMLDCSRNAVLNVRTVKTLVKLFATLGYSYIELYTEDTLEVKGEPYYGYMRGRYTASEIKEIDAYCKKFGMELVPCIQTLAHLPAVKRWSRFRPIMDQEDVLLVGDEKTYEFLDRLFASLAENFTSRNVNIGMDEAFSLGRGRYLDKHGAVNRFDIMFEHLERVTAIADKHGFTCAMWADMFFRLAFGGAYSVESGELPREILGKIPKKLRLIYWEYSINEKKNHVKMIENHRALGNEICFAGGSNKWFGFSPQNAYSLISAENALDACIECGMKDVMITSWGDDGAEASAVSVLPSYVYYGERAWGNDLSKTEFADKFEMLCGIKLSDFLLLDSSNSLKGCSDDVFSTCGRNFLYNDYLFGLFDKSVDEEEVSVYKEHAAALEEACTAAGKYAYVFETIRALCDVLAYKADSGVRIRSAYRANDKKELKRIADEVLPAVSEKLETFYYAVRTQWLTENKICGLEITDIRLGGLIRRTLSVREILNDYISGKIDAIPELEQDVIDEFGPGKRLLHMGWKENVTANLI